jgi:hypothetical protein
MVKCEVLQPDEFSDTKVNILFSLETVLNIFFIQRQYISARGGEMEITLGSLLTDCERFAGPHTT